MVLVIPRNKLIYPGTRPGVDFDHPFFGGGKNKVFTAVASGGGFFDVASGQVATKVGSPTAKMDAHLGPCVNYGTSTAGHYLTGYSTASENKNTWAAIVKWSNIAGGAYSFLLQRSNGASGYNAIFGQSSGKFGWYDGVSVWSSSTTLSNNIPYFIVVSRASTNILHLLIQRLDTGATIVETLSPNSNSVASDGKFYIGNAIGGGLGAFGSIAAVGYTNGFLTKPEVLALARDPWSLWYQAMPLRIITSAVKGNVVYALTANGVETSAPVLGTPTLGQTHALTATGAATSSPSLGTPTLGVIHVLTATGIATSAPALDTPTIGQNHSLTATPLATSAPSLGTPSLSQVHALTGSDLVTSAPSLATPALTQNHLLSATGVETSAPSLATPTLASIHALIANGIDVSAIPALGTPTLSQNSSSLTANGVATSAPDIGTPALGQVHILSATGVETGAPAIGTPTLDQNDAFVAVGVETAVPSLGSPALSQTHALSATPIETSAPDIASPALGQDDVLVADAIETFAPELGTPTLVNIWHADGIETGAPDIASPTLGQLHVLIADGFAVAPPVFGSATMAENVFPLSDRIAYETGVAAGAILTARGSASARSARSSKTRITI